jgi:hypothetical protein
MRRLGLLTAVLVLVLGLACTRDNPAFDDCDGCVGETAGSGDGDGDPSGDGDGDGDGDGGTGDGDGDAGDGDADAGDGDGDAGDGDGDAGDGDGDGDGDLELPQCPDSELVSLPVLKDTFLDGSEDGAPGCVVDWNFGANIPDLGLSLLDCETLDFGESVAHWACVGGSCNSVWLGKFDLSALEGTEVEVLESHLQFTVRYQNLEGNTVLAYELDVANVDFGNCGDWHAGPGKGDPPVDCSTTFLHAAHPQPWPIVPNEQLNQSMAISMAQVPPSDGNGFIEHKFPMWINPELVLKWLSGEKHHDGVLIRSLATLPTQFYLFAQGAGNGFDPQLQLRLCKP